MNETGDTRVMVQGDPGAGKTTFVKYLCYNWAKCKLEMAEDISDDDKDCLNQYSLVLAVMLRALPKEAETCINSVLCSTFKDLSTSEKESIASFLKKTEEEFSSSKKKKESTSNKMLIIFDGYDEIAESQKICEDIIKKEKYGCIQTITTTRPHKIPWMKILSMQQHVKLCGFSDDQIEKYIKKIFSSDMQKGIDLICFFKKSENRHLRIIAKIPICLSMICCVWDEYGESFSYKMVHLYRQFVRAMVKHYLQKPNTETLSTEKRISEKLANLAFSQSAATFSQQAVDKYLGDMKRDIIEVGLLVKYHPTTNPSENIWCFAPRSVQEYFQAYFIANYESSGEEFFKKSRSLIFLERNKLIWKFLFGLNYPCAADNLNKIVPTVTVKQECVRLWNIIWDISQDYPENTNILVPLYMEIRKDWPEEKTDYFVNCLKSQRQIVEELHLELLPEKLGSALSPNVTNSALEHIPNIKNMRLQLKSENELRYAKKCLRHMTNISCMHLRGEVLKKNKLDLKKLIPINTKELVLSGNEYVVESCAEYVETCDTLEHIELKLDNETNRKTSKIMERFREAVDSSKRIKSIKIDSNFFLPEMMPKNQGIWTDHHLRKIEAGDLKTFSECMADNFQGTVAIENDNRLGTYPVSEYIGRIVSKICHAGAIMIYRHITREILQQIQKYLKEGSWGKRCEVQYIEFIELSFRGNGTMIGKIIGKSTKKLSILRCQIDDHEMEKMAEEIEYDSECTSLDLSGNSDSNGRGLKCLLSKFPMLSELRLYYSVNPHNDPNYKIGIDELFEKVTLTNLRILEMKGSNVDSSTYELCDFVKQLTHLETLDCPKPTSCESKKSKIDGAIALLKEMPPSLTYLNMRQIDFEDGLDEVLKVTGSLKQLSVLDIGNPNEGDDQIRAEIANKAENLEVICTDCYSDREHERSLIPN